MTRSGVNGSGGADWIWVGCLCCVFACAQGGAQSPARSPTSSTGDEQAPSEPAASATPNPSEPPSPPEARGPARLTIDAKVRGKSAPAHVRLLGANGAEVARGESGQTIPAESGDYDLEVQITDAAALLDKPTQQRPLTLHAGDDLHESVEFPWAMVQLNVIVNGSQDSGATVHLSRGGERVGSIRSGTGPVALSPGRYEAEVTTRGAKIKVQGLLFPEGATQTVPVRVQM